MEESCCGPADLVLCDEVLALLAACVAGSRRKLGENALRHLLGIADDADRHFLGEADAVGVDVDLDDAAFVGQ